TEFLANFKEFGFENGILLNTEKVALAHEGFYSLFMHNFLARYGDDAENLPLYLEDGLTD
ncbi:MAG: hypothetical protein HN741_03545, partial [Anaerolineae bacterium]|nr:hypothetical protein [Anaerolineae bacterium]